MEKTVNLKYSEGSSNKFYDVSLNQKEGGWTVDFQYGRIGNAPNIGSKTAEPLPYEEALKVFEKLVREKTGKGYVDAGSGKTVISTSFQERDTGWRPQLLTEISEEELDKYLNDDNWCAQEKFDGVRRMISTVDGITGINRKGLVVALPGGLQAEAAELYQVVLDGEAIGDDLYVFDILNMARREASYRERWDNLTHNIRNQYEHIKLVRTVWTTSEKKLMYSLLRSKNAEGIVFKDVRAKYIPGRPASGGTQVKFKFKESASCIVLDVNKTKRSVSIGLFTSDRSVCPVGNVTVYPNQDIPNPGDVIEISYLYAYKGGSLYQPVLKDNRTGEIDRSECTLSQLKYKRE